MEDCSEFFFDELKKVARGNFFDMGVMKLAVFLHSQIDFFFAFNVTLEAKSEWEYKYEF